ncbi:hypothetical protein L7F22_012686 [Adiantum nelumboides]|nr:hypothetical protein [Adiantum nelumboides]
MSSCKVMRGGLKSGDRVGATKKRVRFVDDSTASTIGNGGLLEEAGAQISTEGKACGFARAPSVDEIVENAACGVDVHAQVAANLMQEGLYLQESSQMGDHTYGKSNSYEKLDAGKGVKNAAISCEVCDTCSNSAKESLGTPPSRAIRYHLAGPHGVPHSQLQVSSGVQRRLTFVGEPTSEQMCHSKFVFPNRKNLSRSQNFYKVVPEVEDGALSTSGLTAGDFHAQMQARGLAFDEDACKKRCAWIASQSDAMYVAYHDEEWGVPVHEDRRLFELLVFAGAQAEIAWSTLLSRRGTSRKVFADFDPAILATYDIAKVTSLRSHLDILRSEVRVQSIISNAKLVMKIVEEYGSFDAYLWGFVGNKPIVNKYKQANLIPVRTGKSEAISKDLQCRGFRHTGPMVVYSLMQAAGLVNDHLLTCFRHHALLPIPSAPHLHPLRKPTPSTRKPLASPLCC